MVFKFINLSLWNNIEIIFKIIVINYDLVYLQDKN